MQHPALEQGLDVLINSAGCNQFAWLEDQSGEQVTRQLLLNIEAPIQLTRALLPRLRKPAVIMNIGSSLGAIGYAGYSVYCASKFALRGFSESLGVSWRAPASRCCTLPPAPPALTSTPRRPTP